MKEAGHRKAAVVNPSPLSRPRFCHTSGFSNNDSHNKSLCCKKHVFIALVSSAIMWYKIKSDLSDNNWAYKYEVAQIVAHQFPELRVYLTKDREWEKRFHHNMFDAVALGMMAAMKSP